MEPHLNQMHAEWRAFSAQLRRYWFTLVTMAEEYEARMAEPEAPNSEPEPIGAASDTPPPTPPEPQ